MMKDKAEADRPPLKIPQKDQFGPAAVKRFYKKVTLFQTGDGWQIDLDGRPVKTPAKNILKVRSKALAGKISEEWENQQEVIEPEKMPFTQLAFYCSSLDDATNLKAREEILSYCASDLLFYRAEHPDALKERQQQAWAPVLVWLETEYGLSFRLTTGILHIAQSEDTLNQMEQIFKKIPDSVILPVLRLTKLTGSALLALAVCRDKISVSQAWKASTIDEDWQAEQWGRDAEAQSNNEKTAQAFQVAVDYFRFESAS